MDKIDKIKYIADQLIYHSNLDIIDSAFSAVYIAHAGEKTYSGHKFIFQFAKQLKTAIPDIKIVKIKILSQADNILTWQRTLSGTHKSKLKGIPASDKKVKWYEIVVSRFEENKIVEEWISSDLALQLMLKHK